jgi:LPXTG-motif cell wall-anchored protein
LAPRTSARRLFAALGAAAVGVAATLALATPASAHKVTITADHVCDTATGDWLVTWTLQNDYDTDATVQSVESDQPAAIDGVEEGTVVPRRSNRVDGKKEGVQRVPGSTASVSLTIKAVWLSDDYTREASGKETLSGGSCTPTPKCVDAKDAKYKHTFDKSGKATVELTGDLPLCEGQKQPFALVSYYTPSAKFATPQYLYDKDNEQAVTDKVRKIELSVDLPNCFTQLDLVWGSEVIDPLVDDRYGNRKLGSKGAPGNRSSGPPGWFNGGSGTCAEPAVEFVSACDGSVTVKLINDASGKYDAPFVVRDADGVEQKVSVAPGKSAKVVVKAAAASKIDVLMDGKVIKSGGWERPADCAPPALTIKADCKQVTLTVANPQGNLPADVSVTYGTESKSGTVAAGASQTFTFPAGDAKTAKATFADLDLTLEAKVTKPATCVAPPGLPVTGSSVGGIVAGAVGAVAVGAFLFLRFRRRRVTFTA